MAQSSGFFNALKNNGVYDRKYNATDYSDNMGAIIGTGVLRSGNDDLKVIAAGGMKISVNIGRAWIEGHWYKNDTVFTDFSVPTAPTGERSRIDRVVLTLNKIIDYREIKLNYITGIPDIAPTAPALIRSGGVYQIALADITVGAGVFNIAQSDITDKRADKTVCGWITTPVGYDDYFTSLDNEFKSWFAEKRNTLSSVTLFKEYHERIIPSSQTSAVTFTIPQYDPTGVDIVKVFVNGIREVEGEEYTLSGKVITFVNPKIAGTEIDVFVYKSIDGTGLGTVSDEVTALQNQIATLGDVSDYNYICTGLNDNIALSDIAQAFLSGGTDYGQMTIHIYGNMGVTTPYAGDGTGSSRYRWFSFGMAESTNRRIIFDFENCGQITLTCATGKHYIGFYGNDVAIKNCNIVANCNYSDSSFVMFNATNGKIAADNCRFWVNAVANSYIAETGTFRDCRVSVTNTGADSFCFKVATSGLLRLYNGEYLAYTAQSTAGATAVVYVSSANVNAVAMTYGINCPTIARSGYYQTYAINCLAGKCSFTDTITTLTISAENQNIRGTLAISKPDRM